MNIRKTAPSDLDTLMNMFEQARAYMAKCGNPHQWGDTGYPKKELIEEDIRLGRSYVCMDGEQIVGTFVFFEGDDPYYQVIEDGAWISDKPYGVVHRITTKEDTHGVGRFCIEEAIKMTSLRHLRIDTHEDNKPMQKLLSKLNFKYCGIIYMENHDPRIAFEYV